MEEIKPLGDKVVIRPWDKEEDKYGSIVVANHESEKITKGVVVAVGPGRISEYGNSGNDGSFGKFIGMSVVVGDTVVVPNFGAQKMFVNDEELVICRESELFATLNPKPEETEKPDDK